MSTDERFVAALREYTEPFALPTGADGRVADDGVTGLCTRHGDADVVAFGEATHGTREFVQSCHRLVGTLVERAGFRTLAIEADATATLALNEAVRRPIGDLRAALAGLGTWRYDTEAAFALFSWIRSFNATRPHADRVRVRGIDLSTPTAPVAPLVELLSAIDGVSESLVSELTAPAETPVRPDDEDWVRWLDGLETAAEAAHTALDENRPARADARSAEEWSRARYLCRVVERTCAWHRVRHDHPGPHAAGMAERDRAMGENVRRCLDWDAGDGVVLWAHSSHVQRGTFDDGTVWTDATTMGEHLNRALGDRYRPLGSDFVRGSFRAVAAGTDETEVFRAGEPPAGGATARLSTLDETPSFVDLAAAAATDRLGSWLDRPRRIRRVGSVYDPDRPSDYTLDTRLPASFDGLLVVGESSPTRPLDRE